MSQSETEGSGSADDGGDDDSITVTADADDKTITLRGRNLEFRDLALIFGSLVVIVVIIGALYFGVV